MIRSGRHPHEVALLLVCVLIGVTGTFAYDHFASNTIRSMPEVMGRVFYVIALSGGLVALFGVFWRGIHGPLIERSGLLMLAGTWTAYGIAALNFAGSRAVFFALFVGGFAAANAWRAGQITRELKAVKAAAVITRSTEQLDKP